jgi:hypothetical protein
LNLESATSVAVLPQERRVSRRFEEYVAGTTVSELGRGTVWPVNDARLCKTRRFFLFISWIYAGQPEYRSKLERDGDGVA